MCFCFFRWVELSTTLANRWSSESTRIRSSTSTYPEDLWRIDISLKKFIFIMEWKIIEDLNITYKDILFRERWDTIFYFIIKKQNNLNWKKFRFTATFPPFNRHRNRYSDWKKRIRTRQGRNAPRIDFVWKNVPSWGRINFACYLTDDIVTIVDGDINPYKGKVNNKMRVYITYKFMYIRFMYQNIRRGL